MSIYNGTNDYNYNTLVNNLNYVEEYISYSVLQSQKILLHSIIGGRVNNNDENSKKYKISDLGRTSKSIKWLHRYYYQTKATVESSDASLTSENTTISEIIKILKNHPYNYQFYLNKAGLSIPNINFFIKNNGSISSNNSNIANHSIFNNSYNIIKNNSSINSIVLESEENTVSAKRISLMGSSFAASLFKKVSFNAKILKFDKNTNSYKYANATYTDTTTSKYFINNPAKNNLTKSINEGISSGNILGLNKPSYLNLNKLSLSESSYWQNNYQKNTVTPDNIIYLPQYFNKRIGIIGKARVKYNQIYQFQNNKILYSWWISIASGIITGLSFLGYKFIMHKILLRKKRNVGLINHRNGEIIDQEYRKGLPSIIDIESQKIEGLSNITDQVELDRLVKESNDSLDDILEASTKYRSLGEATGTRYVKKEVPSLRRKLTKKSSEVSESLVRKYDNSAELQSIWKDVYNAKSIKSTTEMGSVSKVIKKRITRFEKRIKEERLNSDELLYFTSNIARARELIDTTVNEVIDETNLETQNFKNISVLISEVENNIADIEKQNTVTNVEKVVQDLKKRLNYIWNTQIYKNMNRKDMNSSMDSINKLRALIHRSSLDRKSVLSKKIPTAQEPVHNLKESHSILTHTENINRENDDLIYSEIRRLYKSIDMLKEFDGEVVFNIASKNIRTRIFKLFNLTITKQFNEHSKKNIYNEMNDLLNYYDTNLVLNKERISNIPKNNTGVDSLNLVMSLEENNKTSDDMIMNEQTRFSELVHNHLKIKMHKVLLNTDTNQIYNDKLESSLIRISAKRDYILSIHSPLCSMSHDELASDLDTIIGSLKLLK